MGPLPQSVSRACPGLWTQAKASEPLGRGGGYHRMLLSPRPAHLSLPSSLPCFPLAPLILFAHWPLCSFQGFPPEVGGWGGGFLLQPLEHRVKMSILPKAIQSIDSMQSLSSYQRYFQRTRTNNFTICMEIQKTSNSQSNLEKEEWNWRNQSA